MTQPRDLETEVLKRLLTETDGGDLPADVAHLDDETLALMAEGSLSGKEREAAIQHLAVCDQCRRVLSLLLAHGDEPAATVTLLRSASWLSTPVMAWAMAAMLLVAAVGVFFSQRSGDRSGDQRPGQIATHDPTHPDSKQPPQPPVVTRDEHLVDSAPPKVQPSQDSARPPIDTVADAGKTPDNLASTIALASAGRLSDYGYGFDGGSIQSRDWPPSQVKSVDTLPEGKDLPSLLNRGQLLLKFGHAKQATEVFEETTQKFPKSALAWLGLGLARYVENDAAAAAKHFRTALELDPKNQSARINLATTLEAQHDSAGARQLWKDLLQEDLAAADREKIQQRVRAIEAEQGSPEKK